MNATNYASRNASKNTAAFGRWMEETSAPVVEVAPAKRPARGIPLAFVVVVALAAAALPMLAAFGIL